MIGIFEQLLLGPMTPDEVLDSSPADTYLTGILWPRGTMISPAEDDANVTGGPVSDEDASTDDGIAGYRLLRPCSAGITFTVRPGATLRVSLSGTARYEPHRDADEESPSAPAGDADEGTVPAAAGSAEEGGLTTGPNPRKKVRWVRKPIEYGLSVPVSATPGRRRESRFRMPDGSVVEDSTIGVEVKQRPMGGDVIVTVTLINEEREVEGGQRDRALLFQARISVTAVGPDGEPAILARSQRLLSNEDDARSSALIYRKALEFAVGHGVAADWSEPAGAFVETVRTTWIPRQSVARTTPEGHALLRPLRGRDPSPFAAAWLAQHANREAACRALDEFVAVYRTWIESEIRAEAAELGNSLCRTALAHADRCESARKRMARGVNLLRTDERAWTAFSLANEAMNAQSQYPAKGKRARPLVWHPFQLAFLLMTLPSIVDPGDSDRGIMDLLWFPTGGGKTEAYLGLTAFTIFVRRLSAPFRRQSGGVDVLMRYTLRLLTVQQFQRAAALIVACDRIRRADEGRLGVAPITLGLYVGDETTPNRRDAARKSIEEERAGVQVRSTPRLLLACPVCGSHLGPDRYDMPPMPARLEIRCGSPTCPEHEIALPITTVDEDIYAAPTSLLIGTVDKFAQLPRRADLRALFGRDTPERPSLIIQDELHLISGPLGSMVGLYEAVVDMLCTDEQGCRPKIIGSTATIGRARKQVRALFDREVFQFPPPGIDAADSFFSVRDDQGPDRIYIGLSSSGRSPKFALQGALGTLMQGIYSLRERNPGVDAAIDPYWTCLAYFNSLRELGGAYVMLQDDVPRTIQFLARRLGTSPRTFKGDPKELSGRAKSSEIPRRLAELERPLADHGDPFAADAEDAVLASNMISVGVDVPRLGLMVVNGQPKSTAEYIQATSRVGREHPGVAVTVLNFARPRDLSHFEHFRGYHLALYRGVEATSVTPWAPRARDKALHAVLVAAVRHLAAGLLGDSDAVRFEVDPEVEAIVASITRRAEEGGEGLESEGTRLDLERIVAIWSERSVTQRASGGDLVYWAPRFGAPAKLHLMRDAERTRQSDTASWATPNSLREIEPSTVFVLKRP
jgi:hypothetical protein